MNHWVILPILLPLLTALLLLLGARFGIVFQRLLNLTATSALVVFSACLLHKAAEGSYSVYALGKWPPPFSIVLVLDRLSALMLVLTAVLALFALLYALNGADAAGENFHMLFQFQLMGLNGAFLTGDLFNLFVFFEILLLASYSLLLHGGAPERTRAALHYVVLNLAGSVLFLIGIGVLYGVTGTLNMADLAVKVAAANMEASPLLRAGALLLLLVFGLKAALFPLYFWLPPAYRAAGAPVAALFAIMTKVGVYAIIRLFTLVFGAHAGVAAHVAAPWLLPISLITLTLGMAGVLASRDLRTLIGYLLIVSIGTLLTTVGLFSPRGIGAALFYLVHTTLVTGGLFLLADLIRIQRGSIADRFEPSGRMAEAPLLGSMFFVGAAAAAGLPPFSGFGGKLLILRAAQDSGWMVWIWSIVLVTSLLSVLALGRTGSILFWKTIPKKSAGAPLPFSMTAPAIALLAFGPLLMVLAYPLSHFAIATAEQLLEPSGYIRSVLEGAAADRAAYITGELP